MNDQFPRYGVNISASALLAQTGTVVLSNSNNVSFGMTDLGNGSFRLTANATLAGGLTNFIQSISWDGTQITSGTLVFANSNGFSFGVNGQELTGGISNVEVFDNGLPFDGYSIIGSTTAINLSMQRMPIWRPITVTRADFAVSMTAAGSQAASLTLSFGVYTMSASTASLASSASRAITWTSGSSNNSSVYGGNSGLNWQSIALATWDVTPGDYLFGLAASLAGVAGSTATVFFLGSLSAGVNGLVNPITDYFCFGAYSNGVSTLPASMLPQDVINTITNFTSAPINSYGQPYFQLAGTF